MICNDHSNPKPHFCGNAPTAFNFFETRSEWDPNLCLDVKHADDTNVNRIWLYHCGRSPAQKWNHSSHLVSGSCCWCCSCGAESWRDNECTKDNFGIIKVGNEAPRARPRQQGYQEI